MSERGPIVPEAPPRPDAVANARIRRAIEDDAAAIATAVEALLIELGGERPSVAALQEGARTLAADTEAGALLVAESDDESVVGILAASWQYAIHVPGHYGTIQDLWVHPEWRSRALGHELILALVKEATEKGVPRLEVGLPQESFAQLAATERFYRENSFTPLGPRMRRLL
jgi:branched-chain amino acid aminotransferase